jgi:membrane carboxypeptidase/penicillin-binding protein PbpC
VGYTPQIVTGVWVGNSDNSPMVELAGRDGAAPIWHAVMEYALGDLPVEEWERPPDVVEAEVCETSGLRPTEYCPTHTEIFIDGTQPTALDDIYQPFQINRETGLLATVYTPPELVEERVYQILPPEAADWVRETGLPQPPIEYDTLSAPNAIGNVVITSPAPYSYVAGRVEVRGNATGAGFSFYRLDYGQGLSPTEWVQIGENQTRPVIDNLLQVWDAAPLEGLYSLRLTMVRGDQSFQEFVIQVTVDNERPRVRLLYPEDQQVYHPSDEFVTIQPLVEDNVSMDRVEFYVDDKLIATSTVPPFNERWFIAGIGRHVIYVRAYDAAGNTTVSQRVTITVERD